MKTPLKDLLKPCINRSDSKESIYLNMMFSRMNHFSENDKKDFIYIVIVFAELFRQF